MTYEAQYAAYKAQAEIFLSSAVPVEVPDRLAAAMRYSLLSGGKRLRPVLLLAACEAAGGDIQSAVPFAGAVEMVHTYSLIHDDLPAMDNDDMRRGRPSCHKAFGEDIAILAGDALLNLAFETMASSAHPQALSALKELALRSGSRGMIAGQTLDVTGGVPDRGTVLKIHMHKTADLIIAPVMMGLLLAGAPDTMIESGRAFGFHLGIAFQIEDDLLDLTGDTQTLGKTAGKDAAQGKMTWPACVGREQALLDVQEHTLAAQQALSPFLDRGLFLKTLAHRTLIRVQ